MEKRVVFLLSIPHTGTHFLRAFLSHAPGVVRTISANRVWRRGDGQLAPDGVTLIWAHFNTEWWDKQKALGERWRPIVPMRDPMMVAISNYVRGRRDRCRHLGAGAGAPEAGQPALRALGSADVLRHPVLHAHRDRRHRRPRWRRSCRDRALPPLGQELAAGSDALGWADTACATPISAAISARSRARSATPTPDCAAPYRNSGPGWSRWVTRICRGGVARRRHGRRRACVRRPGLLSLVTRRPKVLLGKHRRDR